jgi:hypothetical protein
MFMHPYIASQLAAEKQRDMLTQARQQRLLRQVREHARASRRSARAERRTARALRRTRPDALPS